ncbi:DUF1080 domain-containing protein [Blastopirellula marina]|uniref:3-keto-disaccharide hydrolase n=1 Tax=Blastopirellula marina TaxID=124 RepID=UPI001304DD95|nr:DUF1080 domain-containing protein [Blastopirellula marina]
MKAFSTFALLIGVSLHLLFPLFAQADSPEQEHDQAVVPTEVISLLPDKGFSQWYTWLTGSRYEDPRQVFTVQPDGILRISGDGFGALTTKKEYANYRLVMEYRWGQKTWAPRENAARDAGVLLHAQGIDGGYGWKDGIPGAWMPSFEFQIIEGGVGDLLVLPGQGKDGTQLSPSATVKVIRDRDGEPVWSSTGKPEVFRKGRANWYDRNPDWKDSLGYRGENDVDSPGQSWTRIECICRHDELTYLVNGKIVNHVTDIQPSQGKILLQTECAEWFIRKLELHPLPEVQP